MKLCCMWIAIVPLLLMEACTDERHVIESQLNQKSIIAVCPESVASDAKKFLGINFNESIEIKSLASRAKALGYKSYYSRYYIYNPDCSEKDLSDSQQLFLDLGWGKMENGSDVFRSFVVLANSKGDVVKIEGRYAFR